MNLRNSIFILIILLIILLSMGFVSSVDVDDNTTSIANQVQVDEVGASSIGTQNLNQVNDIQNAGNSSNDNPVLNQANSNDVYDDENKIVNDDKLTLANNDVLSADDNNVIYVGTSSAGTADGSREHPYTSIATALSHTVSGKTNEIVVLDGTYSYSSTFTISKDNIIIRADDGANPVISFTSSYSSNNRWTISGNNVTIQGLEFTNNIATSGYSTGMLELTGTNIAVSDCDFTAVRGTRPIYANRGTNLTIENSSFIGLNGNTNVAMYYYNSNNVTIRNNHVEGFGSNSADGSGVYMSGANDVVIDNNTFTNMRSDYGIIYKSGSNPTNIYIQNNRFLNSTSSSVGGAIYSYYGSIHILNNTFANVNAANYGGAIYLNGKNNTISDNSFYNCSATQYGGAIYIPYASSETKEFDNNSFYNCSSNIGGAVYARGNLEITNAYFENCSAKDGSAAYLSPEYSGNTYTASINNSTFVNNNATGSGTVYSAFPNFTVSNSTFENNTAGNDGGAIYISRYPSSSNAIVNISNTTFNNNSAANNGGAIYTYKMYDSVLDNNTFTNNSAVIGGAVFIDYPRNGNDKSQNNSITNSNFENNSAEMGGAVVIYSSDSTVSNSTFTNNNATRYGGGAVIMGGKDSQIINNTFTNNTAFLYGGAIGTNDSYIGNNSFINNSAYQAGAILTINSTIAYNNFTDNNATRGPDIVYIDTYDYTTYEVICNCTNCTECNCTMDNCNCTNATMTVVATNLLINNTLDEDSVYCYNDTQILRVVKNANGMYYLYQGPSNITDRYFYKAYCIEMDASIPLGYNGTDGILVDDLTFVRNSLDQSYVGDYIKVLIILYEKVQYNLKDYIYVFTDGDYMNSDDPIIQNVINITHDKLTILDNGFNIVNDTYSCYWFQSFINPTTRQNLILINGCKPIEFPDLVPTKTADVSKVSNGDNIVYTVKVYNDHNITLTNVTVTDNLGSGDWYISSWTNTYNDAWVRLSDNKWQLNRPLRPGESAQFEVTCHVNTVNGNTLSNTIDVFAHETEHHYVTETVDTERPLIIDKYATKKMVARGELVDFKIVVTNNGKETMNNIRVDDVFSSNDFEWVALTSDVGSWSNSGYSGSGSKITRQVYLSGGIAPGQSAIFTVTLRALKDSTSYSLYNNARLYQNSNYIMEDGDSVSIYTPYVLIDKQVSQSVYNVGDTVMFTIVVRNPTSMPLTGVYVEDFLPDGLQFTNWNQQNRWSTYSTSSSSWTMSSYDYQRNLLRFNLMGALEPNLQTRAIYIYCKATQPGHAINNATAYADGANPQTDRAEYTVLEPSVDVQKTTIERQVYVGENVSFIIRVTNDGNRALTNVVVHESLYKDLTYLSYTDSTKKWIKNSDLSWTYNGTLAVGQSSQFEVTFRADKNGTLTNVVHVSTKEGPSDDDSDNTTVIIRPLTGTKLTVDKVVSVGDNVTFIINVENTRTQPFTNVFVKETDIEGLTFLSWKQDGTDWTYNETSKIFNYGKTLNPGEVASFNVTFRADKMGNWTNVIIYGAEGIKNFTAENDTFVQAFNMSVQKIAIDKVVFLGDEIRFLIVVNNTGNARLSNVYVNETDFGNLTFLRYEAVSGFWRLVQDDGYIFRLAGGLNPNASASFLVVFNATETGNYTNVVVGNSDQVKNVSANNTTSVEILKLKIEKITIDKVVNIGDNVTFTIRVTNIGDSALDDVFVTETSHDGLDYLSFVSNEGNWEYTDGKFKLLDTLNVNDAASFNITFKTTKTGNLTNVIVGTYDGFKNVTTNNTTFVYNANMTVQKITIDTEVMKGDNVTFTIVVKNTGEINLTDVYVNEFEYDGLTYSSYASNVGTWTKEGDSYKLDGILKVGESASFNITFIAAGIGNVTNVVVAGSNETKETKTNNTTKIISPDFEVVKDTLNVTVKLNDEVTFTIVVTNTGDVNLTNVTVYEDYPAGLEYVGIGSGWTTTDNKTFVYDGILEVGKAIELNITFKATALGNLTNVVNVTTPEVPENKTTNKTVTVHNPDFEVVKDTLNVTVRLNDEVTFTIVVTNTGDVNLTNVTVYEDYPAGLEYVGIGSGWTTTDNKTFVYDGILEVGKAIELNITFKATALGNLTNVVNVTTPDVPENKTTNKTITVHNPDFEVVKDTLNKTIKLNDEVTFTIVVTNTGDVNLTNVTVYEDYPAGLEYVGIGSGWTTTDNKTFVYDGILEVGKAIELNITFKATALGNLTNVVNVTTPDVPENKTTNKTVTVHNPDFEVVKDTLNVTVRLNDEVTFTIVVTNTGDVNLTNVTVYEDYPAGLEYVGIGSGWTTTDNKTFVYDGILEVGKAIELNITFKATALGNLTNVVNVTTPDVPENKTTNKTITVHNPDFEVVKDTLNKTIKLNDEVTFTIVVTNTGDVNLTNVTVYEDYPAGLEYVGIGSGWTTTDNKTFVYDGILEVGKAIELNITFKATALGNLTNVVNVTTPEVPENKTTNKTVTVHNPDFEVVKDTLNVTVRLNDEVTFTIVVTNTGDVNLTNVTVYEDYPAGLEYVGIGSGWTTTDNKTFVYDGILEVGKAIELNITFKATALGNLTNVVNVTTPDVPENKTTNKTITVHNPDFEVVKDTLNKTIKLNDEVTFTIVVTNTGDVNLTNVTVYEDYPAGLEYVGIGSGWTTTDNKTFVYDGILEVGKAIELNITFKATALGNLTNVVNVTTPDVPENKTTNKTITVHNPDFEVVKDTLNKTIKLNDEVTFTIVVTNTGDVNLTNVTVYEDYPAGLEYVGIGSGWTTTDNKTFVYDGILEVGKAIELNITFKATALGNLTNVVNVTTPDVPENKTTNKTVTVHNPDFEVVKDTLNVTVRLNDEVTFTIVVTNTGDVNLTNVTVYEDYPAGLEYVGIGSGWTTTDNKTFVYDGILEVGKAIELNITFKATALGNLTNVVNVTTPDVPENKTTNKTITVHNPDFEVVKDTLNKTIKLNDEVTFTIVVTNTGDVNLTNVTVYEDYPAGLEYVGIGSGWTTTDNKTFVYDGILEVGKAIELNITFKAIALGNLTNVVNVTTPDVPENKTTNKTVPVHNPDFEVVKDTLNASVRLNDEVTFTIVVTNTGDVNLTNVTVYEDYPTGLEFVGSSAGWTTTDNKKFVYNGILEVGKAIELNITFKAVALGNLTNVVNVTTPDVPENKTTNKTVPVHNPDFEVTKAAVEKVVYVGDDVTFIITVANIGDVNLTNIEVCDDYPDDLVFKSFEGDFTTTDNKVFILKDTLPVGESTTLNITFKVIGKDNITNPVDVTWDDKNKSDNDTIFAKNPKLSVQKIVSKKVVYVGDLVSFDIIIKNTGNCDLNDVTVTEDYPDGLVYDSFSGNNWKVNGKIFTYDGVLKVGETIKLTVIFKAVKSGNFTNIVQVTADRASDNASDKVEVLVNETPDVPDKNKTIPDKNRTPDKPVTPEKPVTPTVGKLEQHATGNPLALLALVFAMLVVPIRRKR